MENSNNSKPQPIPTTPEIQVIPRSVVSKSNLLRNSVLGIIWIGLIGSIIYLLLGNQSISIQQITSYLPKSNPDPTPTTQQVVSKLNPNLNIYANSIFKYSLDLKTPPKAENCGSNLCVSFPEQGISVTVSDSKLISSPQPENSLLESKLNCSSSNPNISTTCSVLDVQEFISDSNIKGYLVTQEITRISNTKEEVYSESGYVIYPLKEPIMVGNTTYNELVIQSTNSNVSKLNEIAKTFKYE